MVENAGTFFLFYSGNDWNTAAYAIGYAACSAPLGPCTKPSPSPWLASSERAQGPGGQEFFTDSSLNLWMAIHAWIDGQVGYPGGARNLFVLKLQFVNGVPAAA